MNSPLWITQQIKNKILHYKTSSGHCGVEAMLSIAEVNLLKYSEILFKYFRYFKFTAEALLVIFGKLELKLVNWINMGFIEHDWVQKQSCPLVAVQKIF